MDSDLVQVNVHSKTLFSRQEANCKGICGQDLHLYCRSLSGKEGETAPLRVGTASSFIMQQNMRCNFHLHPFERMNYSVSY
jgi:hypothetical protein